MTLLDALPPGADPFNLFYEWFEGAKGSEPSDPDAACLATVDEDGKPSARMVLVRRIDARGFVFFTNENSRKGKDISKGGQAALCYHWKSQKRQVRIEGRVERIADRESDDYYATRPRGSRIGAWASLQSEPLESRAALEARAAEIEKKFEWQDIPRPPHWRGFRVVPAQIEFWEQGAYRLHDRILFRLRDGGWDMQRLYP